MSKSDKINFNLIEFIFNLGGLNLNPMDLILIQLDLIHFS